MICLSRLRVWATVALGAVALVWACAPNPQPLPPLEFGPGDAGAIADASFAGAAKNTDGSSESDDRRNQDGASPTTSVPKADGGYEDGDAGYMTGEAGAEAGADADGGPG